MSGKFLEMFDIKGEIPEKRTLNRKLRFQEFMASRNTDVKIVLNRSRVYLHSRMVLPQSRYVITVNLQVIMNKLRPE